MKKTRSEIKSKKESPRLWEKTLSIIQNISDMTIFESGWETNTPGRVVGPCVRDYYLLHFIFNGKGYYVVDGQEHVVDKNSVFVISPNVNIKYYADSDDPWKYFWIGFNSTQCKDLMESCGFTEGIYVLPFADIGLVKRAMKKLDTLRSDPIAYDYFIHGCLYEILGCLLHTSQKPEEFFKTDTYVKKAKKYIENNFSKKITVNDMANHVGLERSYFSRVFKGKAKISPQQYLIEVRLNHSATLLTQTNLPLNQIALRCAFNDYSHFYKYFYKRYCQSPKVFRERYKRQDKMKNDVK